MKKEEKITLSSQIEWVVTSWYAGLFFRNDITLDRPSEKHIKGGRGGMYISLSFVFTPSLLEWFFPYLVYWLQIIKKKDISWIHK